MQELHVTILSLVVQVIATWRVVSLAIYAGRSWALFVAAMMTVHAGLIMRRVFELCLIVHKPEGHLAQFGIWLTLFNSFTILASVETFRICLRRWFEGRLRGDPPKGSLLRPEERRMLSRLARSQEER